MLLLQSRLLIQWWVRSRDLSCHCWKKALMDQVFPLEPGVVLVDFTDDILPLLRDYNPLTDPESWITPFYQDRPQAIPDPTFLHSESMSWVQSQAEASRVHFYSAREEQDEQQPKQPPLITASKKPPPAKKITNQVLMEQLTLLGDQLKALSLRQDEVEKNVKSAGSAEDVSAQVSGKQPLPRLSDALLGGGSQGVPGGVHPAKKAVLSGPPPKVHERLQFLWTISTRRNLLHLLPEILLQLLFSRVLPLRLWLHTLPIRQTR